MKTTNMSYNEMKAKAEQLGLIGTLPNMKKETLTAALEAYQEPGEVIDEKFLGRPINPNSARQQKLRERELKALNGGVKRGRPVNPESARQQSLSSKGTNVDENGVPRRGRPVSEVSKRQQQLKEREMKIAAGYVPTKGRPANPNKATAKQAETEKRFQIVITDENGSTHNYNKSFKLAKSAIREMKENGFTPAQYKLVEFTALVEA